MTTKALAKPQLRGLLARHTLMHMGISITLGISAGLAYKVFVGDVRKKAYAEFYRTYDAEKDFERMKALGLFSCC